MGNPQGLASRRRALLTPLDHADQMTTCHPAAHHSESMGNRRAITFDADKAKRPLTWTLRPISPDDETALIEFHDRCRADTQHLRFGAAKPQLRPAEAHYLCGVDDRRRGALVIVDANDPGTIHGVGRWERVNPTDAELAFVIEDAHQGQGLGRKLVEATIERARDQRFTRLVTDVLPSNHRMRRLARDYGLVITDL
jgi:RimJ/RimL family protein N-acetyltransferase